jgi:hypothetical protein
VLPRAKRNSYYQVKFRPPDTAISFGCNTRDFALRGADWDARSTNRHISQCPPTRRGKCLLEGNAKPVMPPPGRSMRLHERTVEAPRYSDRKRPPSRNQSLRRVALLDVPILPLTLFGECFHARSKVTLDSRFRRSTVRVCECRHDDSRLCGRCGHPGGLPLLWGERLQRPIGLQVRQP